MVANPGPVQNTEVELPSDDQLLGMIREGQPGALLTLHDRYAGLVYRVAHHILKDSADAEDVLHDVFLLLWRAPGVCAIDGLSFRCALSMMACHQAMSTLRSRQTRTDRLENFVVIGEWNKHPSEVDKNTDQLWLRVADLSASQQMLVELVFLCGMSLREITLMLGEPLETIRPRLKAAIRKLR